MSDWKVGDLAVCVEGPDWINDDFTPSNDSDPQSGEVCTVVGLEVGKFGLALWLKGFESDSYDASEFRKIRPDERTECEPEFVTLLKRGKAPSPAERETRILEALFPPRDGRVSNKPRPINQ